MAPGGRNFCTNITAEELKKIPLLSEYLCWMCKRKKGAQCFSNAQLRDYRYRKFKGNSQVNVDNAKLRCRSCAGEQVHELKCEGQCGLWKSLDEFSKTQRSRGAKWCEECVLWKEALEPGVVAAPPPNSVLAPDEDGTIGREDRGGWLSDPEDGYSDDDDYDEYVSMPYHAMNSLSIAGDESKKASSVSASAPAYQVGPQGPTTGTTTQSEYMPPHLRGFDMRSVSSVSNPYEDRQSGQISSQPGRNGITYNAYDPSGQLHIQQRIPSGQTATRSTTSSRVASNPNQQPRNSRWAKAVGTRTPAPQYVVKPRVPKQTQYDSDESPDEI